MLKPLKTEWAEIAIEKFNAEEFKLLVLINLLAIKKPVDKSFYEKYPKIEKGFLVKFSYKDLKEFYSDKLLFQRTLIDIIDKEALISLENDLFEMEGWVFDGYNNYKTYHPIFAPLIDIVEHSKSLDITD